MDQPDHIDVLLLGAVPQEVGAMTEALDPCREAAFRGQATWRGKYANLSVLIGTTGLGKVNAAITTASLLERLSVRQVWHIGCAGAYPGGPLAIGDVIITEKALCGDEGVLTGKGILPVSHLGIPILVHHGVEFFDQLPMVWEGALRQFLERTPPGVYRQKKGLLCSPAEMLSPLPPTEEETDVECFQLLYGPSLTVGMTSGDLQVASERFRRYGAWAENMEGSAVAHTCCRFEIPMLECRGISNFAGTRAREAWELEKSIAHCHGIIIKWLDALNSVKSPP